MEEKLGVKYTEGRKTEFSKSFRESGPASPVFFILSPGVDPLKDVESLGIVHKVAANMHRLVIYTLKSSCTYITQFTTPTKWYFHVQEVLHCWVLKSHC